MQSTPPPSPYSEPSRPTASQVQPAAPDAAPWFHGKDSRYYKIAVDEAPKIHDAIEEHEKARKQEQDLEAELSAATDAKGRDERIPVIDRRRDEPKRPDRRQR